MTGSHQALVLAVAGALGSFACGGAQAPPPPPPVSQGPEDAILAVATTWEARHSEKGLRSPPSPIASFDRQLLSRVVLAPGASKATEALDVLERFVMRDGTNVSCGGSAEVEVGVAYGRKAGEPALELSWPALVQPRSCQPAHDAVPPFERPAGRARFVLRSDQLVGVEPALEKRTFLPAN